MKNKSDIHTFTILAYKESAHLEDCINSLLSQTLKSKIIITTSTPSSYLEEISKKYKIPLHINPDQNGIVSDWNFAYNEVKTKYVTLAHQDDIYDKNYLQNCMQIAENKRNRDNLITFTGYNELKGSKTVNYNLLQIIKKILLIPFLFKNNLRSNFFKKAILFFGSPIPCPSVMYNKENLIKTNFQFCNEYSINMDWNAWVELAKIKGSFIYTGKKLMTHRIHSDSETSKGLEDNRRQNEDIKIFKKLWKNSTIANIIAKLYSLSYKSNNG